MPDTLSSSGVQYTFLGRGGMNKRGQSGSPMTQAHVFSMIKQEAHGTHDFFNEFHQCAFPLNILFKK